MVANSVNESLRQAYQGSVSAIIQILNDRLATTGVRARAIFEGRVLQLLCEAPQPAQLDQEALVQRVKAVLEDISPRNIRRVHINARIVEEQQLLWLEAIRKHPETLLWSQEISLSRPNLMKHFFAGRKDKRPEMPAYTQDTPTGRQPRRGLPGLAIAGGVVGIGLLGLLGVGAVKLFASDRAATAPAATQNVAESSSKAESSAIADDFGNAVRLAQAAAQDSQTAQTADQWQAIAQKWGQASDLMAKVPATSANYAVAQDRTVKYRQNQAIALKKAQS